MSASKLSAADVASIRERYATGEPARSIAVDFGVTATAAWQAATDRTHRGRPHVDLSGRVAWPRVRSRPSPEHVCRGEACGAAKLTAAEVMEIRELARAGESKHELARTFGVTRRNIQWICMERSWRHLGDVAEQACPASRAA